MIRGWTFFICILILAGCNKNEELLKGEIIGKITVYSQDNSLATDKSGVRISLYSGLKLIDSAFTESNGHIKFVDVAYGKYSIKLNKARFIPPVPVQTIYHVGGYSPTFSDAAIYQIPDYELTVDSIRLGRNIYKDSYLEVFVKLNGKTEIPFGYCPVIGFCSLEPDVSKDNYSILTGGYIYSPTYASYTSWIYNSGLFFNLNNLQSGQLYYIRLYLLTACFSPYAIFDTNALGKASNVMSFNWN